MINVNRARTISAYNPEKHHTDTNDFASILKKKYGKSIAVNEEVSLLKPAMGLVINNHKMSGYV